MDPEPVGLPLDKVGEGAIRDDFEIGEVVLQRGDWDWRLCRVG
ncbi:hypothetical protein ACFL6C_06685 [Myxococcota bacterium]